MLAVDHDQQTDLPSKCFACYTQTVPAEDDEQHWEQLYAKRSSVGSDAVGGYGCGMRDCQGSFCAIVDWGRCQWPFGQGKTAGKAAHAGNEEVDHDVGHGAADGVRQPVDVQALRLGQHDVLRERPQQPAAVHLQRCLDVQAQSPVCAEVLTCCSARSCCAPPGVPVQHSLRRGFGAVKLMKVAVNKCGVGLYSPELARSCECETLQNHAPKCVCLCIR